MAARSVFVTFQNISDAALVRNSGSLDHGEWTTEPPLRIEAGQTVTWESESNGFATGTEGEVLYDLQPKPGQPGGQAHFHWDNPYIGSNSYDESAPPAYVARHFGGGGNNADVTWRFECVSSTGDGIPDNWKRDGVTIDPGDGSGPQFIDLPAMGADVSKPDIFVQLDWMADSAHSHALSAAAINSVVQAFANCPYVSPTGSVGINLHVDAGPASILNVATNTTWGALSRARQLTEVTNLGTAAIDGNNSVITYDWTAFDAIKKQPGGFLSTGRESLFRYCISAHQISTAANSGVARDLPGSDFIVSLGAFSVVTDLKQAGTFMHELGHNLGLGHGGGDGDNNKPNYVSVMNYLWQFTGVTRGTPNIMDYSNAALPGLDESALDETVGLGPLAAGVAIRHYLPPVGVAPGGFVTVADGSKPIDWNGDGVTTSTNVNFDANNDTSVGSLSGYDDWKNLKLLGGSIGSAGAYEPPQTSTIVEMTPADELTILPPDTTAPVTSATVSPPPNAVGWNRTDVVVTLTATDDLSGVALTECDVDAAGSATYAGPIPLSAEGLHSVEFHSIDRSQNAEVSQVIPVSIDKTAPEAVISYDPFADEIVVTGQDALSGVDPGPVSMSSSMPTTWTDFGSDVAELREYRIRDHADNETVLVVKVRCSPLSFELSVLNVRYDDVRHANVDRQDATRPSQRDSERNTVVFDRVLGRGLNSPLLAVEQVVSLGEGDARTTVRARYDVLDDESILGHETGSRCTDDSTGSATDVRGLVLLHVSTKDGRLEVDH